MRTLIVYLLAALALGAGLGFLLFDPFGGRRSSAAKTTARSAPPVVVARVSRAPFRDAVEALGTVLASESVTITARRAAHVVAIHFDDGQETQAGASLVSLSAAEERALLDEAQAVQVERAAAYERALEMRTQGIAAGSDLDTAKAQVDSAIARVRMLEAMLADFELRAPFAGQLGLRQVSLGAFVQPGTPITTLDDLSVVRVDFTIPEAWLGDVRIGMPIAARTIAFPGRAFPGTISAIDTRLDPQTRSATVRARVPNDERLLRPGMLMRLLVDRGENAVLQVPEASLLQQGAEHYVFTVDDRSIAQRTPVTIGRRRAGRVEVLEGLVEDQRLVLEGLVRVQSGLPVQVVTERESES